MIDYQATTYGACYSVFGQPATITTTGGDEVAVTAINKTKAAPFTGFGTEFQAWRPSCRVRMPEILAANLVPADDIVGGELTMAGKVWSIKSFENLPSPVSVEDGEIVLILKDDVNA